MSQTPENTCPCGSQNDYAKCCEPYISGAVLAPTAETLMRARYTAHTLANMDFIVNTHAEETRHEVDEAATREWAERCEWLGLEILDTEAGQVGDQEGMVEFIARYREREERHDHHEVSLFEFIDDRWYFKDAEAPEVKTVVRSTAKVGRNDPCSCGSGKKYKKCCGKAA